MYKELMNAAVGAREYSVAPYSGFAVGACLMTKNGKFYTGCNIENASFSPTICAERTAFVKAISEGEKEFAAIAIVGGKIGEELCFCAPCGVCRQVMTEFCTPDFKIILGTPGDYHIHTLQEIMPFSFNASEIE